MPVLPIVWCNKQASLLSPIKDPSDICSVPVFCRGKREEKEGQREKRRVDCKLVTLQLSLAITEVDDCS